MAKVETCGDNFGGPVTGYMIFCPACNCGHEFPIERWTFNGDFLRPTFSPSMIVTTGWYPKRYPRFPIMKSKVKLNAHVVNLPWEAILPHEAQAKKNHGQSLERLAERGGLSACEAIAILEDRDWKRMDEQDANVELALFLHDFYQAQPKSVCHSFVRDGQIQYLGDCTHEYAGKTVDLPDF